MPERDEELASGRAPAAASCVHAPVRASLLHLAADIVARQGSLLQPMSRGNLPSSQVCAILKLSVCLIEDTYMLDCSAQLLSVSWSA